MKYVKGFEPRGCVAFVCRDGRVGVTSTNSGTPRAVARLVAEVEKGDDVFVPGGGEVLAREIVIGQAGVEQFIEKVHRQFGNRLVLN